MAKNIQGDRRIVFVLGSMGRGGAERVVSILANHYVKKNWNVDIILLLSGECSYRLNSSVNIIDLSSSQKSRIGQLPKWVLGIRSYMKTFRPDTVLAFTAPINIITAIAGTGIKKRLVVSERNDPFSDGRSLVINCLTKLIYPYTDKVIFQTKRAQAYFGSRVINNSKIIMNPVNVTHSNEICKEKIIVNVGRLAPQKNQKLLLEAFKEVNIIYPEYRLLILGEGVLRSELEEYVIKLGLNNVVDMPGNIEEVHKQMEKSEIFVLSSDFEGLSNALLEAMMLGLPVISTTCAGADEVIVHEQNGLLVPIGSRESLYKAIVSLIENKNCAAKLGANAQEASDKFKSRNVLKQWEEVL